MLERHKAHPEELSERAGDRAKVGVDLHQAAQPARELLAGPSGLEALITHDDGAIIPPVPDHPPHCLVHCSAHHPNSTPLSCIVQAVQTTGPIQPRHHLTDAG